MKLDQILKLMEEVPDYQTFLTVDELNENTHKLAAKFPTRVQVSPIGHSRQGELIEALKIGNGSKKALLFAMPHPNEPIGSMMLEFLSTRLAEDEALCKELDFTWTIIKCIDVDSTRLNEGWFKGPFSLTHYARHYYRPPSHLQVEWSFPIDYKTLHFDQPLPETRALMQLIEQIKPDFMFSLHNSGFGGVYLYISHDEQALYPDFYKVVESQDLPLHLGEPEVPYAEKFSPAVFNMIGITDSYNFMEKNMAGADPAPFIKSGCSSDEYAKRFCDPHFLVCEMPYFYNPAIHDTFPSDMIRRNAVLQSLEMQKKDLAFTMGHFEAVKSQLTLSSPFKDTIETNLMKMEQNIAAQENWAKTDPSLDAIASVAEKFDNLTLNKFYSLLSLGTFVRMLDAQIQGGGETPELCAAYQEIKREFEERAVLLEQELPYEVIPIQKLVRVQLGAGLLYSAFAK